MAAAIDTPRYACVQCGREFTGRKRKYCHRGCMEAAKSSRRRRDPSPPADCQQCGTTFQPSWAGQTHYCSARCKRTAYNRRMGFLARQVYEALIAHQRMVRAIARHWPRVESARARRLEYIEDRERREAHRCASCGSHLGGDLRRTFCEGCSDERERVQRRAQKSLRRARVRAGKVVGIPVDPIFIFNRDGWRCHLCGGLTKQHLRGTTKAKAPELDHIIPLANGGDHTPANLACSCRHCNIKKGAQTRGQPSLFGLCA